MKIAIPIADNQLCMHFGHCEKFVIVDVNEECKAIVGKEEVVPPPHEPGLLPRWLNEKGVNIVIAGGMGTRAQQIFEQFGIQVVTGASPDHPQTIVLNWLGGQLVTRGNVCTH